MKYRIQIYLSICQCCICYLHLIRVYMLYLAVSFHRFSLSTSLSLSHSIVDEHKHYVQSCERWESVRAAYHLFVRCPVARWMRAHIVGVIWECNSSASNCMSNSHANILLAPCTQYLKELPFHWTNQSRKHFYSDWIKWDKKMCKIQPPAKWIERLLLKETLENECLIEPTLTYMSGKLEPRRPPWKYRSTLACFSSTLSLLSHAYRSSLMRRS